MRAVERRGKTKSMIWRRDQREAVNYYREPEFLWVRHVTEEADSRKNSCCSLQQRRGNEKKVSHGGRVRDTEKETGTNFYQISLWALCGRSAEEDELHYLAASTSSTARNPFSREKYNDSTRKHRFMHTQTYTSTVSNSTRTKDNINKYYNKCYFKPGVLML